MTKVKSKIDDEIDFLINEDDEFKENQNLMDSFVIKLESNKTTTKNRGTFKNQERNLIKEFKMNPEEFKSNFDRVYKEIYCEKNEMKMDLGGQ